jgi:hypothetical protein
MAVPLTEGFPSTVVLKGALICIRAAKSGRYGVNVKRILDGCWKIAVKLAKNAIQLPRAQLRLAGEGSLDKLTNSMHVR